MDFTWAAETAGTAAADGGGYWHLALILAAIGFLGLFARWRRARMPVIPTARELRERDAEPNRYRDAADKAIVELLETSRVLNAQVDTKIRVLNRLVKDAEEQCARLETLLAEARGTASAAPAGSGGAAEGGGSGSDAGAGAEGRADAAGPKFLSELHERVHRLSVEGMGIAEIAKATNLSTTEVEFMVGAF